MTYSTPEAIQAAVEKMKCMPHLEAVAGLPELFQTHVDNSLSDAGRHPFKAVVFNMERGTRLDMILPYLKYHEALRQADVILANELDWGMARSDNQNIAREIAQALGMNYAFATEFLTVHAGLFGNREGRHGNAIFSRFPLKRVQMLRLPILYEWFHRENDIRLGTRVALLAEIEIAGQNIGLVCLHLENRATPEARERQLRFVLDHVEKTFPDMPILIGGDMNTNTVDGNAPDGMDELLNNEQEQWRRMGSIPDLEPLMACAARYGYSYTDCNLMRKTTRRKHMPGYPDILLNLDWFFQRGLSCKDPQRVETIFTSEELLDASAQYSEYDGMEFSDHDAILVNCAVLAHTGGTNQEED